MTSRKIVYAAIDTERDYQDSRWNADTTASSGRHTVTEWIVFMEDYLREMKTQVSRNADPSATIQALHTMRKVVAMGVACMEQNGALPRQSIGESHEGQ